MAFAHGIYVQDAALSAEARHQNARRLADRFAIQEPVESDGTIALIQHAIEGRGGARIHCTVTEIEGCYVGWNWKNSIVRRRVVNTVNSFSGTVKAVGFEVNV